MSYWHLYSFLCAYGGAWRCLCNFSSISTIALVFMIFQPGTRSFIALQMQCWCLWISFGLQRFVGQSADVAVEKQRAANSPFGAERMWIFQNRNFNPSQYWWIMISIDWDRWWLGKLPNHLPLLLASALAFHLGTLLFSWAFARLPSNTTSSVATTRAHGNSDKNDPQFRRMQWGISAVSFIHALVVGWMALNVYRDTSLRSDRLFGYTQAAGDLYAISCGWVQYKHVRHVAHWYLLLLLDRYFLWDTAISIRYIQHYGIGFVLHAALSLLVYLFAFGPFLMYVYLILIFMHLYALL